MAYIIDKNEDDLKFNYNSVLVKGLSVKPRSATVNKIQIESLTITDEDLTSNYIKKQINKKIDALMLMILKSLNNPDTSTDEGGKVLDEISRLKGILFNKYKDYIKAEEYRKILSKIIILEEQYKKQYNQKIIMNNMQNYYDEIEQTQGRSR